jgi:hypothetical protein
MTGSYNTDVHPSIFATKIHRHLFHLLGLPDTRDRSNIRGTFLR